MRWCFLGSHEISDGERMVMARGGSHICLPCSKTPTGKAQLVDTLGTEGYRPNHRASLGKWSRIYSSMMHRKYKV